MSTTDTTELDHDEEQRQMYVRYEVRGDTARITIDRPGKLNALDLDGWHGITAALTRAAEEAPGPVVLTGTGRAFCAGDDIATFAEHTTRQRAHDFFIGGLLGTMTAIATHPYPVIAAVNGLAVGGGCELVLVSDLAIAAESARFALPEGRIGAWPTVQVGVAAHESGRKLAAEMAFEMDWVSAVDAPRFGLVNRVVPDQDLEFELEETIARIRTASPHAQRLTKRFLNEELVTAGLPKVRRALEALIDETLPTRDLQEGTSAFLAKRLPTFIDA
ncbi:enoyl-CoA hydratase/isomerase family protein [Occultella glacieicola]|uniref:Enoyl-CoA hydratase/isomerase family protein n=1 Tax=Occultella glacieicola TaxID=2518684 RepID=A0ABY2E1U7_9MICO|nr:enoyl-CoA hydratase/isomerase family protein [Occultella glacieicola]TDE89519.1 enoyl-CoA hydratase/isomerase family protein [Occultella glacieicola]